MKILIIKLGAIGDVIMSLTMLTEIERLYPGATITWVCGKTVAPLLATFTQIDDLIQIDENALLTGSKLLKLGVVLGLWRKLAGRVYDLAVIGHGDPAYRLLIRQVKAAETRLFNRDSTTRQWPIMGRHHCDEYARLIAQTDDHSMRRGQFPNVVHLRKERGISARTSVIAISPGGASTSRTEFQLRRWPLENYVALAESLVRMGHDVVITGGPDDDWCRSAFEHLDVQDMIGKTSLVDSISFYSTCDLLISHDSGPMHMASLVGIPVIALFGPTIPARTSPRSPGSVVLWGGEYLPCRPCYDGRTYAACSRNVCLESVHVQQVLDKVANIVAVKAIQ